MTVHTLPTAHIPGDGPTPGHPGAAPPGPNTLALTAALAETYDALVTARAEAWETALVAARAQVLADQLASLIRVLASAGIVMPTPVDPAARHALEWALAGGDRAPAQD